MTMRINIPSEPDTIRVSIACPLRIPHSSGFGVGVGWINVGSGELAVGGVTGVGGNGVPVDMLFAGQQTSGASQGILQQNFCYHIL